MKSLYGVAVADAISPTANGCLLWMSILQNPIAYSEAQLNNYKISENQSYQSNQCSIFFLANSNVM